MLTSRKTKVESIREAGASGTYYYAGNLSKL